MSIVSIPSKDKTIRQFRYGNESSQKHASMFIMDNSIGAPAQQHLGMCQELITDNRDVWDTAKCETLCKVFK